MRGYTSDKRGLLHRLRRAEGQMRGIQRMVDGDSDCVDVLTQISSVVSALNVVAIGLLGEHLGKCVAGAIASGEDIADAKMLEMSKAVAGLVRS